MLRFSKASQLRLSHDVAKDCRRDLFERLHGAWSIIVRRRDGKCVWCGTKKRLGAHHIVARGIANNAGHIDVDNGMALCFDCHIHKLKRCPDEYIKMRDEFLVRRLGTNYSEMLMRYRAGTGLVPKYSNEELLVVVLELERKAGCGPKTAKGNRKG